MRSHARRLYLVVSLVVFACRFARLAIPELELSSSLLDWVGSNPVGHVMTSGTA
jgi:hypothetical protein